MTIHISALDDMPIIESEKYPPKAQSDRRPAAASARIVRTARSFPNNALPLTRMEGRVRKKQAPKNSSAAAIQR
jgi:hypothetical protein